MSVQPSTKQQLEKFAIKPAVCGVVGAATSSVLMDSNTIYVGGAPYDLRLVLGGSLAVADIVTSLLHDYAFPHLSHNQKTGELISSVVSVGAAAGVTTGLLYLANNKSISGIGLGPILAVSVIAQGGGVYLYEKFIAPMLEGAL